MRKEASLIKLLQGIAGLLQEEAERNPEFASKVDLLLAELPERISITRNAKPSKLPISVPDVHAEWAARGEAEFRIWLREQSVVVLQAVIRKQDFDPTHKTKKWKDSEKLVSFIVDGLRSRLARGSGFLGRTINEANSTTQ